MAHGTITVEFYDYSTGSCVISIDDSDFTYYARTIKWFLNGSQISTQNLNAGDTSYGFVWQGVKDGDTIVANILILSTGITYTYSTKVGQSPRPALFQWMYPKTSGGQFNLTAEEWNRLVTNIEYVRSYKSLGYANLPYVDQGETFYASTYNNAARAINSLYTFLGYSPPIVEVSSGSVITAQCLNQLMWAINSIT